MPALGLLVLRLTLAVVLVAHGSNILFGAFAGSGIGHGGLTTTAAHYQALGLALPYPLAVLAGLIQLIGGVLIAVGLLTRWAGVAVATMLAVDAWKDNYRWGFFLNWLMDPGRGHGVEYAVLFGGGLLCLIVGGAGAWSLDGRRSNSAAARAASRARLRTR